jgi:hypothetical protein
LLHQLQRTTGPLNAEPDEPDDDEVIEALLRVGRVLQTLLGRILGHLPKRFPPLHSCNLSRGERLLTLYPIIPQLIARLLHWP